VTRKGKLTWGDIYKINFYLWLETLSHIYQYKEHLVFLYLLCYVYTHVFQFLVDSLNREVRPCYVDILDLFLILVVCACSNYNTWSWNWNLQVRRKGWLDTDLK